MTGFRRFGRSPLRGEVRLQHRDLGEIFAEGGDISANGIFVKAAYLARTVSVGDELTARLPIISETRSHSTILRVTRVTPDGVGMTFL